MADDKPVRPLPERKESFAKKQVERGKGLFSGEPGAAVHQIVTVCRSFLPASAR